jgi:hypothetical protein
MLLFDLSLDRGSSEGHTSLPDSGNIRIKLDFWNALPDAIIYLMYLEYDNDRSVANYLGRFFIMGTVQIICSKRDVRSFLGVFPSDLFPHFIAQTDTVIINADPHTEKVSHWLTVYFRPRSYNS